MSLKRIKTVAFLVAPGLTLIAFGEELYLSRSHKHREVGPGEGAYLRPGVFWSSALWGDTYPAQVPKETELTESPGPDERSVSDQVQLKVTMNEEDMDTYVFAAGTWIALVRLQKEMQEWVS